MRATSRLTMMLFGISTWAVAVPAAAEGVPLSQATFEQKSAAQQAFLAASTQFEAGQYDAALTAFQKSHEIVASPNSRLMIARTLSRLNRRVEAYREARGAVRDAEAAAVAEPRYAEAAEAAKVEMEEARTAIGLVTLDLRADDIDSLTVGGSDVPRSEWTEPLPVEPGAVAIVAQSPTGEIRQETTVGAGESTTVAIEHPPAPPPLAQEPVEGSNAWFDPFDGGEDQRIAAIAMGGVGVVGLVLFTGFGLAHASTFSDLEEQCPDGSCPPELEGNADSGRTYQTLANVGLVVGVIGLAAGTVLFVTTLGGDDAAKGSVGAPTLAIGAGSVSVRGRF